jgi:hypothetical protein
VRLAEKVSISSSRGLTPIAGAFHWRGGFAYLTQGQIVAHTDDQSAVKADLPNPYGLVRPIGPEGYACLRYSDGASFARICTFDPGRSEFSRNKGYGSACEQIGVPDLIIERDADRRVVAGKVYREDETLPLAGYGMAPILAMDSQGKRFASLVARGHGFFLGLYEQDMYREVAYQGTDPFPVTSCLKAVGFVPESRFVVGCTERGTLVRVDGDTLTPRVLVMGKDVAQAVYRSLGIKEGRILVVDLQLGSDLAWMVFQVYPKDGSMHAVVYVHSLTAVYGRLVNEEEGPVSRCLVLPEEYSVLAAQAADTAALNLLCHSPKEKLLYRIRISL